MTSADNSSATSADTPKFTGVSTYQDPVGRFSVRYPDDWQRFEIKESVPKKRRRSARLAMAKKAREDNPLPVREGFGVAPDPDDPHTTFTAWVSPLSTSVVAEDIEELRLGVDAGLAQLAGCTVERASEDVISNLIKFERVYTFQDGDAVRKRRQWLLYVDTWLMCLTWQGSNPRAYQYWLAMVNYSFHTFELPHALWFATDRDLAGARGAAPHAAGQSTT